MRDWLCYSLRVVGQSWRWGYEMRRLRYGLWPVPQLLRHRSTPNARGNRPATLRVCLAWFVNCLILIPFLGMLAAGIAWTAVLMMVFEELDGIGRLQAFGIAAGINICFTLLQLALSQPH
jgi:hypothetical protein